MWGSDTDGKPRTMFEDAFAGGVAAVRALSSFRVRLSYTVNGIVWWQGAERLWSDPETGTNATLSATEAEQRYTSLVCHWAMWGLPTYTRPKYALSVPVRVSVWCADLVRLRLCVPVCACVYVWVGLRASKSSQWKAHSRVRRIGALCQRNTDHCIVLCQRNTAQGNKTRARSRVCTLCKLSTCHTAGNRCTVSAAVGVCTAHSSSGGRPSGR
jgi:hypothetical protein